MTTIAPSSYSLFYNHTTGRELNSCRDTTSPYSLGNQILLKTTLMSLASAHWQVEHVL